MFRLSIRTIFAHKRRLLSTVLSIVIGISFLSGTYVFTDSLHSMFDDLFGSVYKHTDAVVRSSQKIDTGQGVSMRGRIPETLLPTVTAVPGVKTASGSVSGYARILGHDGKPLGRDMGSPNFGMDISDNDLNVWSLRSGRIPKGSTEMAMDAAAFKEGKFSLGDRVTVLSQHGQQVFVLVGVVGFGNTDTPAGSRVALFDLDTAQMFVAQPGQLDAISVRGDGTLTQQELASRISAAMPKGTETLTGKAMAADASGEIKTAMGFFDTLLLVFAFVALFVGSFIIYNTFSIVVAQRRRENALLRAIGASTKQVQSAILLEALVMGVIGSAIGFGAGFLMAIMLKGMLTGLGIDLPSSGLVLLPRTAVVAFAVGIVITVASAVLPARRGAKVPPIAAMRDVAIEQRPVTRARVTAAILMLVSSVVLIGVGLTGKIAILGIGVALLFFGSFVAGPLMSRPVASLLGKPIARLRGMTGALARENAMRNPKRTARTAAALLVGVALVSAISVFASSVKASIRTVFDQQFTGDFVVSTQTAGFGGLPTSLAPKLSQLDGVRAAAGVQMGLARISESNQIVTVVDPTVVGKVFDMKFVKGSADALDPTHLLISKKKAESAKLAIGDTVALTFLDGRTHELKVAGIYERDQLAGPFTIDKKLYATSGGDQYDFSIYVVKEKGASAKQVEATLREAVAAYPTAKLESRTGYIESQAKQVDTFVNLLYGLLALAVIIAVFGIANTLNLSVLERTRELGLLRAVGSTRKQIRSMIRWESVITALLGAVQGVVIGVGLGWAVVHALSSQGFSRFQVPIFGLVAVLVVAMLSGVAAAARPARRAAKLDVLAAISSE